MSTDQNKISELIQADRVVLFMKGSRSFPQCGFSATVVQILDGLLPSYKTVNVLADPEVRQGIKTYSNWPTIPQLYVNGEFIGGCDIVREMHASGDLATALGVEAKPVAPPAITITDKARLALADALSEAGAGACVHVSINAKFAHSLGIGDKEAGEIEVEANGIRVCFDPMSAGRASGLVIDFTEQDGTAGFKLENPNAPK